MKIFSSLSALILCCVSLSAQRIPDPKPVIVKITSTMCNVCGLRAWDEFKDIVDSYEEEAVIMSVHPLELSDLYSPTALDYVDNLPEFFGTPMLYTNDEYAIDYFPLQAKNYVAFFQKRAVVAHPFIDYRIVENELMVTVNTVFLKGSNRPHSLSVFVLEDQVIAPQDSRGPENKHSKVLRTHLGEGTFGALFTEETIEANQEFKTTYRMPLDPKWNPNNIQIAAIIWEKKGDKYAFVNANSATKQTFTTATNTIDLISMKITTQPNPFIHQTTIQYEMKNSDKKASLQLIDISGKIMETYRLNASSGSIEVGKSLTKGLYFAQIISAKSKSKVLKLIHE